MNPNYTFVPMTQEYATSMVNTWRYAGEYAIYDSDKEADHLLDAEGWGRGIFAVLDPAGEFIGEVSVEFYDAQGNYTRYTEYGNDTLINQREMWIGFGLRPDLVSGGHGGEFVAAAVEFAVRQCRYHGEHAHLGVAKFNQRAIKAYQKAGFEIYDQTVGDIGGETFECFYMRKRLREAS